MKTYLRSALFALIATLLALGGASLHAAEAVPAAQLEANKQLVLDFWREVFDARNPDAAAKYVSEDYKQHNPKVPTGREGFITAMKAWFKSQNLEPQPVQPKNKHLPAEMVAQGDLVVVVWKGKAPEPKKPGEFYEAFAFDMFRVKDGKLVEHWDAELKE